MPKLQSLHSVNSQVALIGNGNQNQPPMSFDRPIITGLFANSDSPDLPSGSENEWIFEECSERTITTGGTVTWEQIKQAARGLCTLSAWRKRLPISYWLPKYSLMDFKGDMIAGVTVGLTVVPQGLAFAAIAEVPLEYGLYSAFMGCFMYTLLGTSKDVSLGPTGVLSLMTAVALPKGLSITDRAHYAILLSLFCGISQIILGVLNLGFLVNFISAPVISGFTSSAVFLIMLGQIKTLIGVKFPAENIMDYISGFIVTIKSINGWDTLMGMSCLSLMLLMKHMRLSKQPRYFIKKRYWSILRETVRIISLTRYALVIIVATAIGYYVTINGYKGLSITSDVRGGMPTVSWPLFTWGNRTMSETMSVMARSAPMIVLVGSIESIAVAKAFAAQFRYHIDPTQELIALGLSNCLVALFHGYPITGGFARSALKSQCGVRTPLGCTWTGAVVLFAMAVISPAFKYVPKSALSAMMVAAIVILFEFKIFKDLWLVSKKELLPICVTVVVALTITVDIGLLVGIGVAMLMLLYPIARPVIVANVKESLYTLRPRNSQIGKRKVVVDVTPQGALFFPAAEHLKDFFQDNILVSEYKGQTCSTNAKHLDLDIKETNEEVIFNGIHLTQSDYTTLRALRSVVMNCKKAKKKLTFINTESEILRIVLPKDMRVIVQPEDLKSGVRVNISTIDLAESVPKRVARMSRGNVYEAEPANISSKPVDLSETGADNNFETVYPDSEVIRRKSK